jgi:hypothetical protein
MEKGKAAQRQINPFEVPWNTGAWWERFGFDA